MRVLIVASYNKGYFAPFISEQVSALIREGIECECFEVQGKGVFGYMKNVNNLKSAIKALCPDLLFAHYGLSGLMANFQRKVPVVTTYHGSDINDPIVLPLSKLSMRLSRYNIFVSQKQIDIVNPKRKYALIPCGINLEDYPVVPKVEARRKMGLNENKKYVLFAGAFDNTVKNYPLAKAAVELFEGDVTLLELKGYSRAEVALMMNAADTFLMTSFSEGSPQVIKEAMACGCPIVSVDVGDVKEVFGTVPGHFICSYSVNKIVEMLTISLDFKGRTEGRNRIVELGLTNDIIAKKLVDIVKYVLS